MQPSNDSIKDSEQKSENGNKTSPLHEMHNESRSSSSPSVTTYPYTLFPSTISGTLHAQNSGALDWSINGFLAYGCQNLVVVVDTKPKLSFRQTLHRHKHTVCLLKWSPLNNHICLCSIDTIGMMVIWDVIESTPLTVIISTGENRLINFIHWIFLDRTISKTSNGKIHCWDLIDWENSENDNKNDKSSDDKNKNPTCSVQNLYLLSFYSVKNTIIIYDADLGESLCIWRIDCMVSHINFNPFFHFNRCCDQTMPNLIFEFRSTNTDRIYIGQARLDESSFKFNDNNQTSKEPKKIQLPLMVYVIQKTSYKSSHFDFIQKLDKSKLMKDLIANDDDHHHYHLQSSNSIRDSANIMQNDQQLVQIEFNKSMRNQIFLVFARDIYLIDLTMEMIITTIPIERNFTRLIKIFSCGLRNAFYALHENGNLSFRFYQKKIIHDTSSNINNNNDDNAEGMNVQENFLNIGFVNLCHSEPIRLTKQNKIFGYSLSQFDETKVAFLLSTGRLIIKSLIRSTSSIVNNSKLPSLHDLIKPQEYRLGAFLINDATNHAIHNESVESQEIRQKCLISNSNSFKIIVTNYLSGLNSMPTVIRMAPPLTVQNLNEHKPLLAIGDSLGILQIWLLNNNTATLDREFCAHSYAVAGIEWADSTSLITFSFPTITSPIHSYSKHPLSALQNLTGSGSSSGKVTNELIHIDINTGKLTPFRTNQMTDSSPIETIRVSHLKQYLIILFKRDDPFEIWDVKTLTILRTMSNSIGLVTAIEWSPLYNRKKATKITEYGGSDSETASIKSTSSLTIHPSPIKENFIVMSRELYHFSIEGNIIKELARIPSDVDSGNITVTSIAWKSDQVLFGDASGTLNLWDLKRKNSRTEATYRSSIKKIRFGPGRGNMKCLILYADLGVDIWDIEEFRLCSQLKFPRDINFKIIDFDWVCCDLPVFVTAEGFIVITDQKLKTYSSPLNVSRLSPSLSSDFSNINSNDLNINFLSFSQRKKLIRKFLIEIPFIEDRQSKINDNEENDQSQIDLRQYISNQILLAKLFSNQNDYDFWLLISSILLDEELDTRMDLFIDNQNFRQLLQEKLMILEQNRRTYLHANLIYRINLNLRNFNRSVQILLESEHLFNQQQQKHSNRMEDSIMTDKQSFYVDALKACLIASLQQQIINNNNFKDDLNDYNSLDNCSLHENNNNNNNEINDGQSNDNSMTILNESKVAPVVKLVSTSLIANGHITEGIELLTIISKTSDACRYLQSSDQWFDSIWLAKSSLDGNECTEIMRRWCDYLLSSKLYNDQQTALKIYLSRKQFSRVLRALNQFGDYKSFPLAIICLASQLIDIDANSDCLREIFQKFSTYFHFDDDDETIYDVLRNSFEKLKDNSDLKKCWTLFSRSSIHTQHDSI